MSAFLAILGRDLARLSGLLAIGLVVGLAALASPLVGVWDGNLAAQFAVWVTFVTATVLAGGAALAPDLADRRLVVSRDGLVERTIPLPSDNGRLSIAVVGTHVVAVGSTNGSATRTVLVDVLSGTVREAAGLKIANWMTAWLSWGTPRTPRPPFLEGSTLVELDLATGARHRLLPLP